MAIAQPIIVLTLPEVVTFLNAVSTAQERQ
jgi:hypothetical protein